MGGRPWQYEPLDLAGYIPDFVLPFDPGAVLVEVKPEMRFDGLEQYVETIARSGWHGEALIVGTEPGLRWTEARSPELPILGLLGETHPLGRSELLWGGGALFTCGLCGRVGFAHEEQSYACRVCGGNDGGGHWEPIALRTTWGRAKNRVQWRPNA